MAKKSLLNDLFENKALMTIGGGIAAYYIIVKPVLEKVGIVKSADVISNEKAATNEDAWNARFWQRGPNGTLLFTQATANNLATSVHNAFTVFEDNYEGILGIIKQCKTKSQVSFICNAFLNIYKRDMYQYIRDPGGINPLDGLSTDHLAALNDYVKALPDYKA